MKKALSKLSRRSFFGAAAGAAAAGPLAVEAVAKDIEGRGLWHSHLVSGGAGAVPCDSDPSWRASRLADLGKKLLALKSEPVPVHQVGRLDPDLIANRSLSFSARLRAQAKRDAERNLANQKSWIMREIEELKAYS